MAPNHAFVRFYTTILLCVGFVFLSVGLLFGGDIVSGLVAIFYYKTKGFSVNDIGSIISTSVNMQFLLSLLSAVIVVNVLYLYLIKSRRRLSYFGITKPKFKHFAVAIGYMFLYFISFLMVAIIVKAIFPSIDQGQRQQIGFDSASNITHYSLMFLLIVLIIPIKEELLFRGLLYTKLRERTSFVVSAVIVSIVFGALHLEALGNNPLNWMAAIDTVILSLFLTRLKENYKSLWPCILLHVLKNGIAFAVLFGDQIWLLLQR